uniref:purine-nucleoside phosphorylase n=1 Tax=Cyprinus carpio TaxID=7962 RepID=A0A8C1MKS3_CYPCA
MSFHSIKHDSGQDYQRTADWLLSQTRHRPKVAIICGSGLGMLADALKCQDSFKYSDIPGFPQSTGKTHPLCSPRLCLFYQKYKHNVPFGETFVWFDLKGLLVAHSRSLADSYSCGDIMIICDHINFPGLAGLNPLNGPNDKGVSMFGPRFPPMSGVYDKSLRKMAFDICKNMGVSQYVQEGVYCMVGGPNFESIA